MPTLEHYLEKLDEINWDPPIDQSNHVYGITNSWDRRFISEVAWHTRDNGRALSTGQVNVIVQLTRRYQVQLELAGEDYDVLTSTIANRITRQPPSPSSTAKREVRWIGQSYLAFRFKFHTEIKDALKNLKVSNCFGGVRSSFDHKNKLWVVPVSVGNYQAVMKIISEFNFSFDDTVVEFLAKISDSRLQKTEALVENDSFVVEVKDDALMCRILHTFNSGWTGNV